MSSGPEHANGSAGSRHSPGPLGALSRVALAPRRTADLVAIAALGSEGEASKAAGTMTDAGQTGADPMTDFRPVEVREVLVRL